VIQKKTAHKVWADMPKLLLRSTGLLFHAGLGIGIWATGPQPHTATVSPGSVSAFSTAMQGVEDSRGSHRLFHAKDDLTLRIVTDRFLPMVIVDEPKVQTTIARGA
jgi:hypothetical protein